MSIYIIVSIYIYIIMNLKLFFEVSKIILQTNIDT